MDSARYDIFLHEYGKHINLSLITYIIIIVLLHFQFYNLHMKIKLITFRLLQKKLRNLTIFPICSSIRHPLLLFKITKVIEMLLGRSRRDVRSSVAYFKLRNYQRFEGGWGVVRKVWTRRMKNHIDHPSTMSCSRERGDYQFLIVTDRNNRQLLTQELQEPVGDWAVDR